MTAWTEAIGWAATVVAIVGVVANNKRLRWCFLVWMVSNAISAGLHLAAGMWALTVRDAAFFVLAIYGWHAWASPAPESVKSAKSVDETPNSQP